MKQEETEFIKKEERFRMESSPGRSSSPTTRSRRENTIGILRLDFGKPRRSSGSSVDFRTPDQLAAQGCVEPVSPQPSVDRLSVSFAALDPTAMDKVRFEPDHVPSEAEEEEDYSQSVSAIFQRKASTRRSCKRRRSSSPIFGQEVEDAQNCLRNRRRSSVFTTSSGDTAITMEDAAQEQILQNIKIHKEVLSSVKQQPWNMRRKLRLVRQAQAYIRRHEGELQERLAQSRSTRDILARFNIVIIKHWQHTKRELANLMNVLIPWEIRIKEIESHFGSVVASYFTFLRWLFWVNLVTAVVLIVFVAVPEMLMANTKKAGMRKKMLDDEKASATNLFTLWDFEGVLKNSPLFYGYYSHQDPEDKSFAKSIGYKMPLAYFLTELVVYIYSFVAILRRMAENSRQSKLSEKDDECVFTWKLFTGWDYMIGNSETAHNRTASIILGFKEALLEEAEKKRDEGRNWKVTSLRIFAHMNVVWLLGSSVYAVIRVVDRSTQPEAEQGWWRKNEITIVVSLITSLFPAFFEALGIIEQYHPRKKLRMQLARIMALNLLNIYTLIFASFSKIHEMSNSLEDLRPKNTSLLASTTSSAAYQVRAKVPGVNFVVSPYSWEPNITLAPDTYEDCRNITVPCSSTSSIGLITMIVSVFAANVTTITPLLSSSDSSSSLSSFSTSFPTTLTSSDSPLFTGSSESSPFQETTFSSTVNSRENFTKSDKLLSTLGSFMEFGVKKKDNPNDLDDFLTVNDNTFEDQNASITFDYVNETFETTTLDRSDLYSINRSESVDLTTVDGSSTSEIFDDDSEEENSTSTSLKEPSVNSIELTSPSSSISSSTFTQSPPSEQMCVQLVCEDKPRTKQYTAGQPASTTQITTAIPTTVSIDTEYTDLTTYIDTLDVETCKKLRPLCWETMFGREMVKLTVMDLVMTVISTFMVDFVRALFVRLMNNCWCWDLEKKFPQYGDFKIAENILHLVNNQGMVWMGMFFSPGLPLINIIKLAIMMYLRSWSVLTCNVPHEVVFRASRSNNFYMALLLTMLFLCVLPVGYAVVWLVPSWHCGPFSRHHRIYHIFTKSLKKALPYKSLHKAFDYIASPGIVIPLLMLLTLIIYYLISLTSALREANNDLKIQLRRERTEERRKMFQLVDKKRQEAENPVFKWRKAMANNPQGKMSIADIPIDILKAGALSVNGCAKFDSKHKDIIQEFMKKTKRKPSGTSEEENCLLDTGDGTDIEQHDSLPYDNKIAKSLVLQVKKEKTNKKILKDENGAKKEGKKKREKRSVSRDREDSVTSGWSDIPEIRIIQTESAEKLDSVDGQSKAKGSSDTGNITEETEASNTAVKKGKNGVTKEKTKKRSESKANRAKKKNDKTKQGTEETTKIESNDSQRTSKKRIIKHKKQPQSQAKEDSSTEKHHSDDNEQEAGSIKDSLDTEKYAHAEMKRVRVHKSKSESKESKTLRSKKLKTVSNRENSDNNNKSRSKTLPSSNENNSTGLLEKSSFRARVGKLQDKSGHESQHSESEEAKGENDEDEETDDDGDSEDQSDSEDEEDESENEEDSKSDSNDDDRTVSKKHEHSEEDQINDTESEDSDKSSQNTVKQVDIQKRKRERENKLKNVDSGDETDEESSTKKQQTKEPKSSKKTIARFKIANVLLKEARRRSSAGLEEK